MESVTILIHICSSLEYIWSDHYVWIGPELKSWNNADAFCVSEFQTRLASIHSADDNLEVTDLCYNASSLHCFIGLNDKTEEGLYEWTDSSTSSYLNWDYFDPGSAQPNGEAAPAEDCTVLFRHNGYWHDTGCEDANYPFICNAPNIQTDYQFTSYSGITPAGFAIGSINNIVYILGGVYSYDQWQFGGNQIKKISLSNHNEEILSVTAPQAFTCRSQCSVTIDNQYIYIMGFVDSCIPHCSTYGAILLFDMLSETWQNTADIAAMPVPVMFGGVTADTDNNIIYIVGGFNNSGAAQGSTTNIIQIYDVSSNKWTYNEGVAPDGDWVEGAVQFYNDFIFIFGGHSYGGYYNYDTIWKYDVANNILTEFEDPQDALSVARTQARTIVINNMIYVIGGRDIAGDYYKTVDLFVPNAHSPLFKFNAAYHMNIARGYHGLALYDDKIYVFGGMNNDANETREFTHMLPSLELHVWSDNNEYIWVGPQDSTWNDAQTYCSDIFGTQLVSIHNDTQNVYIQTLCTSFVHRSCYIGLNDQQTADQYVWDDGSSFDYSNWNPAQPSSSVSGFADCTALAKANGEWALNNCDGTGQFTLCHAPSECGTIKHLNWNNISNEMPYYDYDININEYEMRAEISIELEYLGYSHDLKHVNGYYLIDEALTWIEGQSRCESFGTNLATISSQLENDDALALCNTAIAIAEPQNMSIGCFFGANDLDVEGTFAYIDGTNVSYTNWYGNQPNATTDENCGRLDLSGEWFDDPCSHKRPILCNSITHGFGTTYFISLSPFHEASFINSTNACENRLRSSFIKQPFTEWWTYSKYPFIDGHIGSDNYLAYPPPGDLWTLSGNNPHDLNRCDRIHYYGEFDYDDLYECATAIVSDDIYTNITAELYVNVVSPTSITDNNGIYYSHEIINESFTISYSNALLSLLTPTLISSAPDIAITRTAVASTSDTIYILGGESSPYVNTNAVHKLNHTTFEWDTLAVVTPEVFFCVYPCAVTLNHDIYIFPEDVDQVGDLGIFYIFDTDTESFTDMDAISTMITPVESPCVVSDDDNLIYIIGGRNGLGPQEMIQIYNIYNNSWHQINEFPFSGYWGYSCSYFDAKLYLFGGHYVGNCYNHTYNSGICEYSSIWRFDTTWNIIANMSVARARCRSIVGTNNLIYIIGGNDANDDLRVEHDIIEIFDPITNIVIVGGALMQRRFDHSLTILNNNLYVIGGKYYNNSELQIVSLTERPNTLTTLPTWFVQLTTCGYDAKNESSMCLQVDNDSIVYHYSCVYDVEDQAWEYNKDTQTIENKATEGCLDVESSNVGARLQLTTCDTTRSTQQWIFRDDLSLYNVGADQCIDINATDFDARTQGGKAQILPCNSYPSGINQLFCYVLLPTPNPTYSPTTAPTLSPITYGWSTTIDLPKALAYAASASISSDTMYIFGGSEASSNVYKWNQTKHHQTWTQLSALTPSQIESSSDSADVLYDRWVYIYDSDENDDGIVDDSVIYIFDAYMDEFLNRTIRVPFSSQSPCLSADKENNKIYLIGGAIDGDTWLYYDYLQVYDVNTSKWSLSNQSLSSLPVTRYSSTCELAGNYLYVFGGNNATFHFFDTIYRYDIDENKWIQLPSMNTYGISGARSVFSHELNLIYIGSGSDYNAHAQFFEFDPRTNTTEVIDSISVARYSGMVEILNGILFIFGGRYGFNYESMGEKYPLFPTHSPTYSPTNSPSLDPTNAPSNDPTNAPSGYPSISPSNTPTQLPTDAPSIAPSSSPTSSPSEPPTNAPSIAPSQAPTERPTMNPTSSPSQPPTDAPSIAPSLSPTACVDLYPAYNSIDGMNELNVTQVAKNIDFEYRVESSSMRVDGTSIAAFTTDTIQLNDTKREVICGGLVACFQSNIICATTLNDSFCNILCSGYLSCSEAIISANNIESIHVICSGEESCSSTQIWTQNVNTLVTIDCVLSSSCDLLRVSLENNVQNIISCYLLNSCNNLNVFTTDYTDTTLKLYSYSNDIIFDNGFGLTQNADNIECMTNNKFIRYDSSLTQNESRIQTLIESEYASNLFPCNNNIQIYCDQNTTDAIDQFCTISYSVDPITAPQPLPQCYWVNIDDLIKITCPGSCIYSPTKPPTSSPTVAPTQTTKAPTSSPSFSPTINPSFSPSQPPSNAPSYSPSNVPSDTPSVPPTSAPSNVPSLSPTNTPSQPPTYAPSQPPSSTPSQPPSTSPSNYPTNIPSQPPTISPTQSPSVSPSNYPTNAPSQPPSLNPSNDPSSAPSQPPTSAPSHSPTFSPSLNPTISPTNTPSEPPTNSPSNNPSSSPSEPPTNSPSISPTNAPSQPPSIAPTNVPTFSPSLSPSNDPSQSPTNVPTDSPSNNPSNAPSQPPTNAPSISPTNTPSQPPTDSPSNAPSIAPSNVPSYSPSNDPTFSPSVAPTTSPTESPTNNPTYSPTRAPSRYPTESNAYYVWIDIVYDILNYTRLNIDFIINDTMSFVKKTQEIIEKRYFVSDDVLSYKDFAVYILEINDVDFNETALEFNHFKSFEFEDPIRLKSQIIASDGDRGGVIKRHSANENFRQNVENDLQVYFKRNGIRFEVEGAETLEVLSELKMEPEATDWTVAIISIIVVGCGSLIGLFAFVFNRKENSKVDNAAFAAIILVSLQIYDLISDINLINDIFSTEHISFDVSNILLWCGISALTFTVIPFASNMYYAVTIPHQSVVRQNTAASAYFKSHLAEFVLLVVCTGGCFPALSLVSSRIFALDLFNCGLTNFELNQLVKIKIRSTITLENGPQLLIQIIYTISTGEPTIATILAFMASLLSIVATLATFYAQTNVNKSAHSMAVQYSIYFGLLDKNKILTKEETLCIELRKERKRELNRLICGQYRIPFESLEIGFVKIISNGCIISMVHHVFPEQLKKFKKRINYSHNAKIAGFNISIDPQYYTQELCKMNADAMRNIIVSHFKLDDKHRFIVKYSDDDDFDDDDDDDDNKNKNNSDIYRQLTHQQLQQTLNIAEETEEKSNADILDASKIEMTQFRKNETDSLLMQQIQMVLAEGIKDMQKKQQQEMQRLEHNIFEIIRTQNNNDVDGEYDSTK